MKRYWGLFFLFIVFFFSINSVEAIHIGNKEINIGVGTEYYLSVSENVNTPKWYSTNKNIATVDIKTGLVIGKKIGKTYITVNDGINSDTCVVNVISNYQKVTDIKTARNGDTLTVGESRNIDATVSPSNASNKDISYVSINNKIATVSTNGTVKAVSPGSTYIQLVADGKSIKYAITVVKKTNNSSSGSTSPTVTPKPEINNNPGGNTPSTEVVKLSGIETDSKMTIMVDETKELKITYTPENATDKKVTYKSSNESVASISDNGVVKGISKGNTTITVTSNDGAYVAKCRVTVTELDYSLRGITLDKTEIRLNPEETATLTVQYDPENATNKDVIWRSSKKNIASVKDGVITALKPGITEIKAISQEGNYEASCKVIVISPPIESIAFSSELEKVYLGSTTLLELIPTPEDTAINDPIWTSSDETVASINEYGELTALSLGTTTVTISDKEGIVNASIEIKVVNPPPEKVIIDIAGYDINFQEDKTTYSLHIGSEKSLNITTNLDQSNVVIVGNNDLRNGSIVTVSVDNAGKKATYTFDIIKNESNPLLFIVIISILLIINIIRILVNNNKKKRR